MNTKTRYWAKLEGLKNVKPLPARTESQLYELFKGYTDDVKSGIYVGMEKQLIEDMARDLGLIE